VEVLRDAFAFVDDRQTLSCSWRRAFSMAIPACSANVSTSERSSSLKSSLPILLVRYRRPSEMPLIVIGTPRKLFIGGWFGGNP